MEKACKNCRHWSQIGGTHHLCIASKGISSLNEMRSACGLHTKPDFYCKIFTPIKQDKGSHFEETRII